MKKVIVYSVYAIGMTHHGTRSLTIGGGYYGRYEPDNQFDSNAVAVCIMTLTIATVLPI